MSWAENWFNFFIVGPFQVNDKLATDPEEAFQWWEYILSITLALNK
jgi:hypothetical protein